MADVSGIRINKFLSEAGVCSRREADRMLADGRVCIDRPAPGFGRPASMWSPGGR